MDNTANNTNCFFPAWNEQKMLDRTLNIFHMFGEIYLLQDIRIIELKEDRLDIEQLCFNLETLSNSMMYNKFSRQQKNTIKN